MAAARSVPQAVPGPAPAGVLQAFNYTAATFDVNLTTSDGSAPGVGVTNIVAWIAFA